MNFQNQLLPKEAIFLSKMVVLDIILNILSSGLPCVLLALGIFLTYRLLDFADLTAEGSFLIGMAVCGVMIYNQINPWIATLTSIFAGALCGIVTGVLNRFLKIPKLLSGIITLTAAGSIVLIILGSANDVPNFFNSQISFTNIVKGSGPQTIYSLLQPYDYDLGVFIAPWSNIIKVAVMFGVVFVTMVIIYFFFGTEYGMAIRATGMNEKMAKAQGINANAVTIACVAISNALIALAGALYVQETKTVSTVSATGYLVVGLASILIGEAIFGKRSFKNWLISVALGSIVYFIIITTAVRLGLPTELQKLLYAILITLALCLPLIKMKVSSLMKKKATKEVKQ